MTRSSKVRTVTSTLPTRCQARAPPASPARRSEPGPHRDSGTRSYTHTATSIHLTHTVTVTAVGPRVRQGRFDCSSRSGSAFVGLPQQCALRPTPRARGASSHCELLLLLRPASPCHSGWRELLALLGPAGPSLNEVGCRPFHWQGTALSLNTRSLPIRLAYARNV